MKLTAAAATLCAAFAMALLAPPSVSAGTCASGGCHQKQLSYKFLHGPVAAEEAGAEGCASCHVPTGARCTPAKGGKFSLKKEKDLLCLLCHEQGTGTQHTRTRTNCLSCHSPHGSGDGPTLLRKKG